MGMGYLKSSSIKVLTNNAQALVEISVCVCVCVCVHVCVCVCVWKGGSKHKALVWVETCPLKRIPF